MNRRRLFLAAGAATLAGAAGWRVAAGSGAGYAAAQAALRAEPAPRAGIVDLIRLATLAPSGHNAQPWLFRLGPDGIDLLPDAARRTPAVDPDDHHLHVSLGAAAETLAIAAPAFGRPGELTGRPDGSLRYHFSAEAERHGTPLRAILRRQTVRADYDGQAPAAIDLDALRAAAALPGVRLALVTDRPRRDRLRELAAEGAWLQFQDAAFLAELRAWLRFNPRAALGTGDGLYGPALGLPAAPTPLGRLAFDLAARPEAERDRVARRIASTPALAVFFAEEASPRGWAQVGRALARFALAATERGLKTAHVNQPVEVAALRPELAALAGEPDLRPSLVLRLGFGPDLPYAPRRAVARVLA